MVQDESRHAWILTVEPGLAVDNQPHYFYRLGAGHDDLALTLRTADFQVAPDRTLSDDGLVRVGMLSIFKRRPSDNWAIGHASHHYHLQDADTETTVNALLGVELHHATRISDAVEGALGEPWDLRLS